MVLTFRKSTGEVVMIGQNIENEALSSIELPDDPKMKAGYQMKIKDGQIEYEKTWWMENKEKEEQKAQDFIKDIDLITKAKSVDELKPLLLKLILRN